MGRTKEGIRGTKSDVESNACLLLTKRVWASQKEEGCASKVWIYRKILSSGEKQRCSERPGFTFYVMLAHACPGLLLSGLHNKKKLHPVCNTGFWCFLHSNTCCRYFECRKSNFGDMQSNLQNSCIFVSQPHDWAWHSVLNQKTSESLQNFLTGILDGHYNMHSSFSYIWCFLKSYL